jgi:hypothetical protein
MRNKLCCAFASLLILPAFLLGPAFLFGQANTAEIASAAPPADVKSRELEWFNRHLKGANPEQSKDEQKKAALSQEPALIKGCEEPSRAAINVLDEFMAGFNSKDIKKFEASYNFPHVRLAGGRVTVLEGPSDRQQIFEGLNKSIGWDYTRYDERQIIHCGSDKVHIAVRVTRYRKDHSPIHTFDSLYIVTNQKGKWGIQMRSSYAPET